MSGLAVSPLIRMVQEREVPQAAGVLHRAAELAYRDINWNHVLEETVGWFCTSFESGYWSEVLVADIGGEVVAVMCLKPEFVDQLFVDPAWQRKGIGTKILAKAKEAFPRGFDLYVFQKNLPAIHFYEQEGLARGKAGISPDEQELDFLYHWRVTG